MATTNPLIFTALPNQETSADVKFMTVIKKNTDIVKSHLAYLRSVEGSLLTLTPEEVNIGKLKKPSNIAYRDFVKMKVNKVATVDKCLTEIKDKIIIFSVLNNLLEDPAFNQRSVDKMYACLGRAVGIYKRSNDTEKAIFQSMAESLKPYISPIFRRLLETHINFVGLESKKSFSGREQCQQYLNDFQATVNNVNNNSLNTNWLPIISQSYVHQLTVWANSQLKLLSPDANSIIEKYDTSIRPLLEQIHTKMDACLEALRFMIDAAEDIDKVMRPYIVKQAEVAKQIVKNTEYIKKYNKLNQSIMEIVSKHSSFVSEHQKLFMLSDEAFQKSTKTLSTLTAGDPEYTKSLVEFKLSNDAASLEAEKNGVLLNSIILLQQAISVFICFEHCSQDADYTRFDAYLAKLKGLSTQLQLTVQAKLETSKQEVMLQHSATAPGVAVHSDQKKKKKPRRKKAKDPSKEKTNEKEAKDPSKEKTKEKEPEEKQVKEKERAWLDRQREKAAPEIEKINYENAMKMSRALTQKEIEARQENIRKNFKANNTRLETLFKEFYSKQFGHTLLNEIVTKLANIMDGIKMTFQSRHYTINIMTEGFEETAKAFVMEEGFFKPFIIEYVRACFYRAGYTPALFGISSDYKPDSILVQEDEKRETLKI